MKVSTKLYAVFFLQFMVAIFLVGTVLHMQKRQKYDSLVINLAGRQRMLSQKLTKELLLFSEGHLSVEKAASTINVFHDTLNSLHHGGRAPLDLAQTKFAELPKPKSSEVVDQLQKVDTEWKQFRESALKILKEKDTSSLEQIKKSNVPLLEEMNNAVFLMDKEAAKKVQSVFNLLLWGCGALVALFLTSIGIILRNLKEN